MKKLFVCALSLVFALVGCDNKQEKLDGQRKAEHDARYRAPPPSDRADSNWLPADEQSTKGK